MEINWQHDIEKDLAIFRYSGRADMRGVANGVKHIMSRFPSLYWLHDLRKLTIPRVHESDMPYLLKKHVEPYLSEEYRRLRSEGRDAVIVGENGKSRLPNGISHALELLVRISPKVRSFDSESKAMQWLIQSD
jgi:hypothetical protein